MPTSSTALVKVTCKSCHKEYEVGRKAHVCAESRCCKCGHMFKKSNLGRHVESCGKANKCNKCGDVFRDKSQMKAHKKSCTGAPAAPSLPPALTPAAAPATPVTPATHATSVCSAASSPGSPPVTTCPDCGLTLQRAGLARHRRTCGKWVCAKCGTAFATQKQMKQHVVSCTPAPPSPSSSPPSSDCSSSSSSSAAACCRWCGTLQGGTNHQKFCLLHLVTDGEVTQRALCHVLAERRILLSKANLQALLLVNEDLQVTAAGLDMKSVEQLSHNDRYRTLKKLTAEEATLRANCTEDEVALADDTAGEYHQTYLSNASSFYQLNPEAVKRDTQIVEERAREEYQSTSLASAPSARKLEDWTVSRKLL